MQGGTQVSHVPENIPHIFKMMRLAVYGSAGHFLHFLVSFTDAFMIRSGVSTPNAFVIP